MKHVLWFVAPLAAWLAFAAAGCHASPRKRPPLPPADVRVAAAIAAWGQALRSGDAEARAATEDSGGRAAFVYVGVKAAASQVPDGAEAVEHTVAGNVLMALLHALFHASSEPPPLFVVLPTGSLGPTLVDAGLAAPLEVEGKPFTVVELPREQTLDRLQAASDRHRERLRARKAWTCRPTKIERTILPSEPSLVHAATVSQHIFAWWLESADAIWLVRARCASGPGWFVVTGHVDRDGTVRDQILVAASSPRLAAITGSGRDELGVHGGGTHAERQRRRAVDHHVGRQQ